MRKKPAYINIYTPDCSDVFTKELSEHINSVNKAYDEICVACIGTDRSTGDSLGPLVGYKISKQKGVRVVGTLDKPLHAKNLEEFTHTISERTLVIAVDACLGSMDHVGYLTVNHGPLKPGSGVDKELPAIGDISIAGIVNFGGFMDFLVLQNTRLSLVMKMADIISEGLGKVLDAKEELQ
jgi:putative sporulation protein YyaC